MQYKDYSNNFSKLFPKKNLLCKTKHYKGKVSLHSNFTYKNNICYRKTPLHNKCNESNL